MINDHEEGVTSFLAFSIIFADPLRAYTILNENGFFKYAVGSKHSMHLSLGAKIFSKMFFTQTC